VAAALWLVSAAVPPPARFLLWALALTTDVATAVVTSRHAANLPPHAAHLPERFGLFTLILLGESIVAIVKGIQSQIEWTPAAAVPALAGIGLVFTMWWGYFEAAGGADDRHVRTRRDVRLLDLWSYAHVLLYLGVAIAGVGVEHIVRTGGTTTLHTGEALLVCGAVAIFLLALTLIGVASDRVRAAQRRRLLAAAGLAAALMLGLAPLAHAVMPGVVVAALTALAASYAMLLKRIRTR
jgi:low temperature requirement protein LtrA